MNETYDFKTVEPKIRKLWEDLASPAAENSARTYSMFLNPPNASGPMHVGNALMIALQDILARYHRARGDRMLWIPSTDHGGYETQVTFERNLESKGENKEKYTKQELYDAIEAFVAENNKTIVRQTKAMGASVDWSHFRFTLDEAAVAFVNRMFRKMVSENLMYRGSYMLNYCPVCATMLADIELREKPAAAPLYFVKFPLADSDTFLPLATSEPEFLFATTHVLIHPEDTRFSEHIGRTLLNPITGEKIPILESKRKFDPEKLEPFLTVFSPSSKKYDFEYAIRHKIPTRNLIDWEGKLIERYPGLTPREAREKELRYLKEKNLIERLDEHATEEVRMCKKNHPVENIIRLTWFLRLDAPHAPLRQSALEALEKERLTIHPHWRKKGLVTWIQKMHDWPIARQNAWGIAIPMWYEISDPSLFMVWFRDQGGRKRYGNLGAFLDEGIPFEAIERGLERVYADEGAVWTLEREEGKVYLPETDTFDVWFSSGAWGSMVFDAHAFPGASAFYPSNIVIIGHDLLRLAISREIILGVYLNGRLPFKHVYFHPLLTGPDGQKMSKSLGNDVTLDHYLEAFGADVTRMALVSYLNTFEDFFFSDERLTVFQSFADRLWNMGRVCDAAHTYEVISYAPGDVDLAGKKLLSELRRTISTVALNIEKNLFTKAQEQAVAYLKNIEEYSGTMLSRPKVNTSLAVLYGAFATYLELLHPFMPFQTEELYATLYPDQGSLAARQKRASNHPR